MTDKSGGAISTGIDAKKQNFARVRAKRVAPMPTGQGEENLATSSKNGDENDLDSLNGKIFAPHPPDVPKDSAQRSPRRLQNKNTKRFEFEKRRQRKDPKGSSSDEDRLAHRTDVHDERIIKGSKLPPLSRTDGNVKETHVTVLTSHGVDFSGEAHLKQNSLVTNLKPLSPIKEQTKLVENFKSKQSLERERQHEIPERNCLKPLKASENVSNIPVHSSGNVEKEADLIKQPSVNNKMGEESESTLTSVSSDDSSDVDSDSELSDSGSSELKELGILTKTSSVLPFSYRHGSSLSLTSVRDKAESSDRHSDSEAMRRERNTRHKNSKVLWNKARKVTLLPRVPASKARDRNSNFIKEELDKYLPERKLMVFVGTWNMHGEKQLPIFVDDFLLPECCQFMQDLYVIGSQESTPLRKEWEIKLQEALGPSHVLIYSCGFGVLHLAIYLRRELVWFCSAVEQATVATRPGHMIKTKGAIGLTLSIFGTSFLFINSHLTAHEQKWKERVADYRLIRRSLSLPLNYAEAPGPKTDVTSRFDQVFWFGDFNFRVEERQGVVEKFIRQCQDDEDPSYDELVAKDQMTKLMNKGGVFEHFKESRINFAPTYRFDINPDDPGKYSSIRVPSWTDRIVYRSDDGGEMKALHYDSCTSLDISDHRPVYGIFEASIKPIKDRVEFTGVQFVRDVYIEANRRRAAPARNQHQTSVCIIL